MYLSVSDKARDNLDERKLDSVEASALLALIHSAPTDIFTPAEAVQIIIESAHEANEGKRAKSHQKIREITERGAEALVQRLYSKGLLIVSRDQPLF